MKALKIFMLLLLLTGCKTVDDIMVKSLSEDAINKITSTDILFLKYKTSYNTDFLNEAETIINGLERDSKNNKYFEAKVISLYCQLNLLRNNKAYVTKNMPEIEKRNSSEERLFLIKADMEKNFTKKEDIIKKGLQKSLETDLLKLYIADLYFLGGKFAESTSLYDEALINLNDKYKIFYKKRRDLAFYFTEQPPKNNSSITYLLEDEISVGGLIMITLNELKNSKQIIDINSDTINDVYNKLVSEDFLQP